MDLPFIPAGYSSYVILAVVVLVGLKLLSAILGPRSDGPDIYVEKRCGACGWRGKVSKHHLVCRKCNAAL